MPFGGGRIVGTYDDSEAHYFLTDHLGSTWVVAKVTTAGRDDLDRKDYYPFGKAWMQAGMPISENRYTFSGKEQVNVAIEDGITTPIHDFGGRYYGPDGALFFQQDPKIEKYISITPYNYCFGNPIVLTSETTNAKTGIWAKGTPDNNSAAHEFGHILGLDDKYNRDSNDHEPLPGWETNLMAGSLDENKKPRQVEQRNIDMFLENAMKSGATVYYIDIYNSEMYKNEKQ